MLIETFKYDNKNYIIEMNSSSIVFYTKEYGFLGDEDSFTTNNNTKNPVKVLRKINNIIKNYVLGNKIKYFTVYGNSEKRAKIYRRFLDGLDGYSYYENEGMFYVTRNKN